MLGASPWAPKGMAEDKHREYFSMITIQKALETTQDGSLITFITGNQTLVTEGRCAFSLTVWVIPCLFICCALQMNLTPTALQCGPKMPRNNSCGGDCIVCVRVCACVCVSEFSRDSGFVCRLLPSYGKSDEGGVASRQRFLTDWK